MSTVPLAFRGLVDDAAVFPPGNAALARALAEHREHRVAPYADLVGPFLVPDVRLPDLIGLLRAAPDPAPPVTPPATPPRVSPLPVNVVVTGGAGALEPAVRWAGNTAELHLRGVETALRDEADLARNARRVARTVGELAAAGLLPEETVVYVEPPPLVRGAPRSWWLETLDELAASELRLKLRTGGVTADAFPAAGQLAEAITAALDRELPFKCTAGLHRAVRHRDPTTGFEHQGFLNLLLATRVSLDGAPAEEVADALEETDPAAVGAAIREYGEQALASARRWFTCFGSCSVRDPLSDLRALGLLPRVPLEVS